MPAHVLERGRGAVEAGVNTAILFLKGHAPSDVTRANRILNTKPSYPDLEKYRERLLDQNGLWLVTAFGGMAQDAWRNEYNQIKNMSPDALWYGLRDESLDILEAAGKLCRWPRK